MNPRCPSRPFPVLPWLFFLLCLFLSAARGAVIVPDRTSLTQVAIRTRPPVSAVINLTSPAGAAAWTATSSHARITVTASGTTPGPLTLTFDPSATTQAGDVSANITVRSGADTLVIPVIMRALDMRISQLVADLERPVVYGLNQNGNGTVFVFVINDQTGEIMEAFPAGANALRMDVDYRNNRFLVTGSNLLRLISMANRQITATFNSYGFSTFGAFNIDPGVILLGGISTSPSFVNASTGAVIRGIPGLVFGGNGSRVDAGGHWLYEARTVGGMDRVNLTVTPAAIVQTLGGSGSTGPISLSGDGNRVGYNFSVYDPELRPVATLPAQVIELSFRGELAVTQPNASGPSAIFALPQGQELHRFSTPPDEVAFTGDQKRLMTFDSTARVISVMPLPGPAIPLPGTVRTPADGSTVALPLAELHWDAVASALRYRVFFGTSQAAVTAAGTSSPEFLGEIRDNYRPPPAGLLDGQTYFWRVDVVRTAGTTTGPVWRFTTGETRVTPANPEASGVAGGSPVRVPLTVTAPAGTAWALTESIPWISLENASGAGPGAATLVFLPAALAKGAYTADITLTAGSASIPVPVRFTVQTRNIIKLESEPGAAFVYGLNSEPFGSDSGTGHIVAVNPLTGAIEKTVPVPWIPTDLDIAADGVYVISRGNGGNIVRFNSDLTSSQTRALTGLQDTGTSNDGRPRVAAAGNGIVYWRDLTEARPRIHTLNFTTGAEVGQPLAPGGATLPGAEDIQMSPGNTHLLATSEVGFFAIDFAEMWRFRLTPAPVLLDTTGAVLDQWWNDDIITAPLLNACFAGELGFRMESLQPPMSRFPIGLTAGTPDGSLVFSRDSIFRGTDGAHVGSLPSDSLVMATVGNDRLIYFSNDRLNVLDLAPWRYDLFSDPVDRAALPEMPSRLRIPEMSGTGDYTFFFGTSAAAVAAAVPASPEFLGTAAGPEMALNRAGSPLEIYFWRADRGGVQGAVHRFTVRAALVDRIAPGTDMAGGCSADNDDLIATTNLAPEQALFFRRIARTDRFEAAGSYTVTANNYFITEAALKDEQAWIGSPNEAPSDAGAVHFFNRGSDGKWPAPARFTANTVRAGEFWAASISPGDNYLAVGVSGYNDTAGCVDVMNPLTGVRIARLTVPGAARFHRNGSEVAASGEWIAAQGYFGTGANIQLAVKLFRRTTAWAYHSMISRTNPRHIEDDEYGDALAMEGNTLAVSAGNATDPRLVQIYTLTPSGAVLQQEIKSAPARDGTDFRFGRNLALRNGILAISASREDNAGGTGAGRIYLYRKPVPPATTWEPLAPVEMPAFTAPQGLGGTLAMSDRYLFAYARTSGGVPATSVFLLDPAANRAPWFETTVPGNAEAGKTLVWPVTARDDDDGDTAVVTSSALPPFLTLSDGALRGTPSAAGLFNADLIVTDNHGAKRRERFALRVFPAGGVPAFTLVPEAAAAVAGAPLTLRADGPAGVTWQWFYKGQAVPGATQKTLTLDHAGADDAGPWFVRMNFTSGFVDSPEIMVTVSAAVSRFGGGWKMAGHDPGHTSYSPTVFGAHTWRRKWKVSHGSQPLFEPAIADGRVFATGQGAGTRTLKSFVLKTGAAGWSANRTGDLSGPAADRFGVFTQRMGSTLAIEVESFAPDSGTPGWSYTTPWGASGQTRNFSPLITPAGLFYLATDGCSGFDRKGFPQFYGNLTNRWNADSRIAPAVAEDSLITWVGGAVDVFSSTGGQRLFSIKPNPADTVTGGVPVVSGEVALVRNGTTLYAIDLEARSVLWSRTVTGTVLPAVRSGEFYMMEGAQVAARSMATGALIRSYTAEIFEPTSGFQPLNHPVVTDDLLIASTPAKTFVFDRLAGTLKTTLADGGLPALSDGWLVLAGRDGSLAGYYAGQAPEIAPGERTLAAVEDQPFTWTLQPVDFDGDTAVSLSIVSKPAWLNAITGAQGQMILTGTPLQAHTGTASLIVRSSDSSGDNAQTTFTLDVAAVNDVPLPAAAAVLLLNEDEPVNLNLRSPALAADEEDGDALTWSVQGIIPPFLLTASVIAPGLLSITPQENQFGDTVIHLRATDSGGLSVDVALQTTVRAVNDAPAANRGVPVIANEDDAPLRIPLAGVFRDVDDPEPSLQLSAPDAPTALVSAVVQDRDLILTFAPDASGNAIVRLVATDPGGLIAETLATVKVNPVPDAPRIPVPPAPLVAAPADNSWRFAAGALFNDPDPGERLTFTIVENTNAALFASLTADSATGALDANFAPYRWGTARLRVRATGLDQLFAETWVELTVPEPPAPGLTAMAVPRLNRQTGLTEWNITVKNNGLRAIGGCEVLISGLPEGVEVYNASGKEGAAWIVRLDAVFAPGEEKSVVVEYHSASRLTTTIQPSVSARPVMPVDRPPPSGGLAVDRVLPLADGILVEFPSVPGKRYEMQWSADGNGWQASLVPLRAAGTRVQWIDRGPPRTASPPLLSPARFYRVQQLD